MPCLVPCLVAGTGASSVASSPHCIVPSFAAGPAVGGRVLRRANTVGLIICPPPSFPSWTSGVRITRVCLLPTAPLLQSISCVLTFLVCVALVCLCALPPFPPPLHSARVVRAPRPDTRVRRRCARSPSASRTRCGSTPTASSRAWRMRPPYSLSLERSPAETLPPPLRRGLVLAVAARGSSEGTGESKSCSRRGSKTVRVRGLAAQGFERELALRACPLDGFYGWNHACG